MYSNGFQILIDTVWSMLNTVVIPSGAFGSHGNITFLNIMLLGLGATFLCKFIRLCTCGHFNFYHDKDVTK